MNTLIGTTARGEQLFLLDSDQGQHIDITGATGMGKSVLLQNLAAANLQSDAGLCVIDPHGSLAEAVLALVPPHRGRQVVFLNMADLERPIGLSFMSDIPEEKRFKVAEDIVATFVHIWGREAVGDRSQWVLRNALRAVMDDGGTLLSIPKFLTNKRYRSKVLKVCRDEQVKAVWDEVFAGYTPGKEDDVISPILNKLDALLVPPLRNILAQPQATIDVRQMMDEGRILIVSLQKGMIGELPARFLGALIVAHLVNVAFSRADMPEQERRPFYLFADEFHNFVSGDFETVLSETRKYRLFFRLANQYPEQLDHRLHEGILTNCETKITFRCSPNTAKVMAPIHGLHEPIVLTDPKDAPCCEFGLHTPQALTQTAKYWAWVSTTDGQEVAFPVLAKMAPPPERASTETQVAGMIADSRSRFGRPRDEVEFRISQFLRAYAATKRRRKAAVMWEP